MQRRLIDGTIVTVLQDKIDPTIKYVWTTKNEKTIMAYTGSFDGLMQWIKKEKKLAEKRETRSMIADMCGTSYSAAMADMGLSRGRV